MRILLVDDEEIQLDFTKISLEDADPSLRIVAVLTPTEALQMIREQPFDCIVSDYAMPEMDGIQLCAEIRKISEIPFMLYTGRGSEEVAQKAFAAGVDDYLRKEKDPAHYHVLVNRIRHSVEKHRAEEAPLREKNISDTTIEGMPGIFYLFDSQGRFLRWNKNFQRVSGYTSDEISGMQPLDFFVGVDKRLIEQRIREVFTKGESSAEAEFVSKDGHKIPYFFTGLLTRIDGKNCLVGMGVDITERKRMERELKRSNEELQTYSKELLTSTEELAAINKRLEDANEELQAANEELRVTTEELAAANEELHASGEELRAANEELQESHNQLESSNAELEAATKELQQSNLELMEAKEKIEEYANEMEKLVRERTKELRESEDRLRKSSLYARSLIEASLDPLVTISAEGKITDVNKATEHVTGVSREQMIGSDFSDYFTEPKKARTGYEQVFADGFVRDYPLAIRHTSGKVTDVLYNATVYRNEAGEIQGVFAAARDVTKRKQAEERVRAASLYSRSLIEASLDPLVTISAEGKITDVNKATEFVTGFGREQLIGSDFSDYFTEPERARAGYQNVFTEGFVRDYPLAIRHVSGRTTDVLYSATVYRNEKGEVQGVFAAARDITERKRLEEEVKADQERLEAFMESAPDQLYIYDKELNLLSLNWAALKTFPKGTHEKDVLGRNIEELRPGIEWTERYEIFKRVLETGEPFFIDAYRTVPSQESRWSSLWAFKMGDNLGVIARDIQEQKELEEKLRSASLYARSLIEASMDPLVTISPEGKITDVNTATEEVTGVSREQLIGSDFSEYFTDPDKARAGYKRAFNKGFVRDYPLAIRHKSGKVAEVLYNATVYRNRAGEVEGIFAAARDVTERNLMEEKIHHAERVEAISKLTGMVAHDLRGPLNTIIQATAMAKRSPDRTEKMLTMIGESAERSLNMIEELRSGTKSISIRKRETDLAALIRKTAEETLIPKTINVEYDLGEGIDSIMLDPDNMRRVLENLIRNSVEAMPEGGTLTLRAFKENERVCMEVSDTGRGIPEEAAPRMFEPFYTTKPKGVGLGLAFCKSAVEAHGGTITFRTKKGEGTTFTVTTPA
jgi:PAS domain S-box-containing protein